MARASSTTHPNHGGRRRPTAAMVPHSRRRDIRQIIQYATRQVDVVKNREYVCYYYLLTLNGTRIVDNTPRPWRPPSAYGRYSATLPAPRHSTMRSEIEPEVISTGHFLHRKATV